ncbi:hydroxyethylthiazole kinase [uncultured Anaerococcus sp.]|uniref:hydroxyethylthiazole kinase n=1 Tax=uncultured Anaerococcus sp. TaxID=293428 RepID=UPI00262A6E0A|nr:hydroxyethylthiazole kinase [uncultured Anaerococcus sp.]
MNKNEIKENIKRAVEDVRRTKPMAPSITNTVTVNLVANTQLAVGGAAAMAYLEDEVIGLASISKSFYINLGTMFDFYMDTLAPLADYLEENNHKWVLDPVAAGLGEKRSQAINYFKDKRPTIIRANASEILAIAEMWGLAKNNKTKARGVEAEDEVEEAKEAAIDIARHTGGVVAISGKVDLITDGKIIARSYGGSDMMESITGAGCSLGGVCAVFESVTDSFTAALTATQIYNLAGFLASEKANGPASFQTEFLDALYKVNSEEVANNRFEIEELDV